MGWKGSVDGTIKVDYRRDDVQEVLDGINADLSTYEKGDFKMLFSHEILLKRKANLHKYLVAVCCGNALSSEAKSYIQEFYLGVKILDEFPKSSDEMTVILNDNS